jgi:hypothetical protein
VSITPTAIATTSSRSFKLDPTIQRNIGSVLSTQSTCWLEFGGHRLGRGRQLRWPDVRVIKHALMLRAGAGHNIGTYTEADTEGCTDFMPELTRRARKASDVPGRLAVLC